VVDRCDAAAGATRLCTLRALGNRKFRRVRERRSGRGWRSRHLVLMFRVVVVMSTFLALLVLPFLLVLEMGHFDVDHCIKINVDDHCLVLVGSLLST
jgi:hypothetical protein